VTRNWDDLGRVTTPLAHEIDRLTAELMGLRDVASRYAFQCGVLTAERDALRATVARVEALCYQAQDATERESMNHPGVVGGSDARVAVEDVRAVLAVAPADVPLREACGCLYSHVNHRGKPELCRECNCGNCRRFLEDRVQALAGGPEDGAS
jgi:hypothetical protein